MRRVIDERSPWQVVAGLAALGFLAACVRAASDPPQTLARVVWMVLVGWGCAAGGWLAAKALGMDLYPALLTAYAAGVVGAEALLKLAARWMERVAPRPPEGKP